MPIVYDMGFLGCNTGHWSLATGYWLLLATGHWLLATGYWLLATGHWVLLLATGYWLLTYPSNPNPNPNPFQPNCTYVYVHVHVPLMYIFTERAYMYRGGSRNFLGWGTLSLNQQLAVCMQPANLGGMLPQEIFEIGLFNTFIS